MSDAVSNSHPPGEFYCPTCECNYSEGPHCPQDGTRLVRLKTAIDPLLGRNLDGRYTIVEKLGQGGMGAVYRGTQHSVGREVAIKVISAHLVSDRDAIKRFLREAKLASRLSHPNAVAVLEFGQTDDGLLYLVMELVTGRTLDAVIKREGVLKPERIVRIGSQVCDALEGAHALQIVHRDLKPANIMLLSQGRDLVKVLDFGLAKSVAPDQATTTMTNAGALLGTPAYMPPELALGGSCDGRADLYSLGVILYLLGSGRLPFVSESVHELVAMQGHEPAPPMTGVPPGLAAVIDRLLEKKPQNRYQSATDAREALEAALESRMITPPPGGWTSDTNPSLGPFPASSNQFGHMRETPAPGARHSTAELERIVSSDTVIAPTPVPALSIADRSASAPKRSRRGLFAVAGVLIAAAVAIALVVGLGKHAGPAAAPATPPATPPVTPSVTTNTAVPVAAPTPDPTPPVAAAPVASPAAPDPVPAAAPPPATTASKHTAKTTATAKTKTKSTATSVSTSTSVKTTFKPPTTGINPTRTPTGVGSGSAKVAPPPF